MGALLHCVMAQQREVRLVAATMCAGWRSRLHMVQQVCLAMRPRQQRRGHGAARMLASPGRRGCRSYPANQSIRSAPLASLLFHVGGAWYSEGRYDRHVHRPIPILIKSCM